MMTPLPPVLPKVGVCRRQVSKFSCGAVCANAGAAAIPTINAATMRISPLPDPREPRAQIREQEAKVSAEQAGLARLDLQGEIFRIDAALGEAARDEPKPGLLRAHEH